MRRVLALALAVVLALVGLATVILPVPLEVPLMSGAAVLALRNSAGARRLYVRGRRRWPGAFRVPDRILRPRFRALARV
jgi:heme A synthase